MLAIFLVSATPNSNLLRKISVWTKLPGTGRSDVQSGSSGAFTEAGRDAIDHHFGLCIGPGSIFLLLRR